MDKNSCREMSDLRRQVEQLKVEIGDLAREKQFYKARLATIEHELVQNRDVFKENKELLEALLRYTKTVV